MGYSTIRDLSRSFVGTVRSRGLDWTSVIVTNGSLLDARKIRELANGCMVTHAEVTIDGTPEVHDKHRPLKSQGGSFWRIVEAISGSLSDPTTDGMTFGIRTNVDVNNRDNVDRLLLLLSQNGFSHPRIRLGIKPVHSWGNDVSALEIEKKTFAEDQIRWLRLAVELGLNIEILPTAPAGILCPAVTQSDELIDPSGQIFSCSEQPLVDHLSDTALGSVTETWASSANLRPKGQFDDWHAEVAQGQRSCSSCELYPTCGGACPKLWREGHWPCPSYKFNMQQRLDLVAEINGLKISTSRGKIHGNR